MKNSLNEFDSELVNLAIEARKNAYARYSKFRVGSALRDEKGRVFVGCNVENASYGLTICAERVAIFSAIAQGSQSIDSIAVVTSGEALGPPCGACRQVIQEFGNPDTRVILANNLTDYYIFSLRDLFPHPFHF